MASAKHKVSQIAPILEEVLPHIVMGDFDRIDNALIFGTSIAEIFEFSEQTEDRKKINGIKKDFTELVQDFGKTIAARRASIVPGGSKEQSTAADNAVRYLDAHYAGEIIRLLEKIVRRASLLEELKTAKLPDLDTQTYFQEAMRCYLYGFDISCAVLCRAVIESTLKESIDPNGNLYRAASKEKDSISYVWSLLDKAEQRGILQDDRPACARRIVNAGNWAIHKPELFKKEFPRDKLREIVVNTRKVLEDMLAAQA